MKVFSLLNSGAKRILTILKGIPYLESKWRTLQTIRTGMLFNIQERK